jgi:hypothetical protein
MITRSKKFYLKFDFNSRKCDPVCLSRIQILMFHQSRIQRFKVPDVDPQHRLQCCGPGAGILY